jgi:YD repeat-containing protein
MRLLCLALLNWALALVAVAQSTVGVQPKESPLYDPVPTSAPLDIGGEISRERLPENWSDADVFGLRTFTEPLVAESKVVSEQERGAFSRAINNYLVDGQPESLESFLRDWPESRWAGAIEHNLGLLKYREGYFTAALGYWESAWNRLKDSKDARLHALANQSLAELAGMDARLGRIELLRPLLGVLKEREVGGSARQMLDTSSDALHEMEARPDQSFKCGPYALANVRKALGIPDALASAIREIRSPYRGFALTEISHLATTLGMPNQMAKWSDAVEIPVPSVVNWKLGHYAAIIGKQGGKYRVKDLTFGFDNFVSAEAIRAEASGYFLLPVANVPAGFEMVSADEGFKVFGRGNPNLDMPNQLTPDDEQVPEKKPSCGMADYTIHTMMVSLHVEDAPVGYAPPFGPAVEVRVSYNERETLQPANLNYTNFGRQWTHNWNGCIKITSTTAATVVIRGGGSEDHSLNPSNPNAIHPKSHSRLLRVSPTRWDRLLPDGSREVYQSLVSPDSQGLGTFWLSQVIDPAGNAVTLKYDSNYRLSTITDALGQRTTFSYSVPEDIYKVSAVTDPFGRQATFSYDANGELVTVTDVIGMQSHFGYASGDILESMTTPYGTTSFARQQRTAVERWIEVTDPLGGKERVDSQVSARDIHDDPPAVVPARNVTVGSQQVPFYTYNQFMNARNTYYWDKKRMLEVPGDYTKVKVFHFLHARDFTQKSPILESVKEPMENRVWFNYPGQSDAGNTEGTIDAPNKVARVIEDGTTQLWQHDRNALANVTRAVDPLGRETLFDFAPNGIDLLSLRQKNGGAYDTLASFTWNSQHRPLTSTEASMSWGGSRP